MEEEAFPKATLARTNGFNYSSKNMTVYFSKWITAIAVAKLTFDGCSSSSIYKVIRSVLNFLFFFKIRFHKYKKS